MKNVKMFTIAICSFLSLMVCASENNVARSYKVALLHSEKKDSARLVLVFPQDGSQKDVYMTGTIGGHFSVRVPDEVLCHMYNKIKSDDFSSAVQKKVTFALAEDECAPSYGHVVLTPEQGQELERYIANK